MRLKSDLLDVLEAVVDERLDTVTLDWDPRPAVTVVMASEGYPGHYERDRVDQEPRGRRPHGRRQGIPRGDDPPVRPGARPRRPGRHRRRPGAQRHRAGGDARPRPRPAPTRPSGRSSSRGPGIAATSPAGRFDRRPAEACTGHTTDRDDRVSPWPGVPATGGYPRPFHGERLAAIISFSSCPTRSSTFARVGSRRGSDRS